MNPENRPTVRIIVASHKVYQMPDDPMYIPLLVGSDRNRIEWSGKRDNEGDNISSKNPYFCELTGLYWAWKNVNADYIGLVHYRRHFSNGKWWKKKAERIISEQELTPYLQKTDIILPKKRHYWIETNFSQYVHAHHSEDLELTRQIIESAYPQYIKAYDGIMKKTSGHRFNMLIMKKEILDQYCEWLFSILFELESKLDISSYSINDQRVFGFVGERLLDVWLDTNGLGCKDHSYVFLEHQNWLKKGFDFFKRKAVAN